MKLTVTTHIFGLPTGQRTVPVSVTVPSAGLSVRELIARKIEQEWSESAERQRPGLSGEAFSSEELLGAAPLALCSDAREEVERAQRAFAAREFMVVIDNQRVCDPDEVLSLNPDTRVEFIKILPMVGG
jgi:hypothetical protein